MSTLLVFVVLFAWPACGVVPWLLTMRRDYGPRWLERDLSGFDLWGLVLAVMYGPIFGIAYLIDGGGAGT